MAALVHFWAVRTTSSHLSGISSQYPCGAVSYAAGDRRPSHITCLKCKASKQYRWWCAFYYLAYEKLTSMYYNRIEYDYDRDKDTAKNFWVYFHDK